MAKAKAVAMPDFIPDEQMSQYEAAPDFISDEQMAGTAKPSASSEIMAKHAKNVAAEQAIYKPSLGDVWTQGYNKGGAGMALTHTMGEMGQDIGQVLKETPERLAGAGKMLYKAATEPAQVGMQIPEMIRKGTEPLISPRTTGKALMEAGVDTALTAGAGKLIGKGVQGLRGAPEGVVTPKIQSELMRGIKPINRKTEFKQTLTKTVPEVVESSEALRRPIKGIEDVEAAIPHAKMRVWSNYQQKLGPNAKMTIDGNLVADAMEGTITKRFETQNPSKAQAIRDVAATYRRDIPLDEAEDFLQGANNDLHSFYAKNKVGRDVAARDPEWGHVVKEAEALRENLYKKLDEVAGPDAAELKRTYGELTSLNEEVLRRKNVSQRQNPTSLAEQISFAQAAGRALKATMNLNLGDAASAIAQPLTARYLKNRGSSDALIERGFGRFKPKPKGGAAAQILEKKNPPPVTPQAGEVPRPMVKGTQLQPYAGPERRGPGVAGMEQRAGYSSAQQASANPEVAQRALELNDIVNNSPPGTKLYAEMDELQKLADQYDWVSDYIAYGRSPVQRGGIRR